MSAIAPTLSDSPSTLALPRSATTTITSRHRIVIGGLGALTPILLNFLVVDVNSVFASITAIALLGYGIRVVGFFSVGGLVAYMHKDEKNLLKLFELGIIAPALLTGVMNGTKIKDSNLTASMPPTAATASVTDFFIPTAYAQGTKADPKTYKAPTESIGSQFWRGLSGSKSENVWHVVAGTYDKNESELKEARELARKINSTGFKAEVYQNDKYYAVVIGANLTPAEAKALKQKASEAKIPTKGDMYLYNPWTSE